MAARLFPINVPLTIVWQFTKPDNTNFDITGYSPRLYYRSGNRETEVPSTMISKTGNTLSFTFPTTWPRFEGEYHLKLLLFQNNALWETFHYRQAWAFVRTAIPGSQEATQQNAGETVHLFTCAEYYLFQPIVPTVDSDGYWVVNGTRVTDGSGNPVPSSHTVTYDAETNQIIIDHGRVDKNGNSIAQTITALDDALDNQQELYEAAEGTQSGSVSGDGSRWGSYKAAEAARNAARTTAEGTKNGSTAGDGSMWGEYKAAEAARNTARAASEGTKNGSTAGDGSMWGEFKANENGRDDASEAQEGTKDSSTASDGTRWGEYKNAEQERNAARAAAEGTAARSIAGDGSMWGTFKSNEQDRNTALANAEGSSESSTAGDGSRWGSYKAAEDARDADAEAAEGTVSSNAGDGSRWGAYKTAEAARNTARATAEGSSSSTAGDGSRWGAYKTAEVARGTAYETAEGSTSSAAGSNSRWGKYKTAEAARDTASSNAEGSSSSTAGDGTRWGAYKTAEAARGTAYGNAEGTSSSEAGDGTRWGAYKTAEAARETDYESHISGITDLEEEVSQLGQKWKEGPDVEIKGFITGAYSTNGNYSTNVLAKSGAKGKNLDVTPGQKYRIYATSDASTWYRCCAVFKADGTKILTAPAGDYTVNPFEVTIPSDGAKMTINLINYNSATDGAFLITGETDASTLQGEIDTLSTAADAAFLQDSRNTGVKMKADRYSAVNVDWMQVVSDGAAQNNNTIMTVVSATSDTLTLASEDAAQFVVPGPAAVHYPNGDVKVAYFQAASGTSVELWPTDDTDLTNADYVQNLHDTARGGAGIHLSQLGYIMLGQFTAQQVADKLSQKDSNFLAGVMFYNASISGKSVLDELGNEVATIDTDFATSGFTPNENGLLATYGIVSNDSVNLTCFGYLNTAFRFQQGVSGQFLTLSFPARGEGFVEIEIGWSPRKPTTSTGTCTMEVYADGVKVYTTSLRKYYYRYQIPNVKVNGKMDVKFNIDSNTDTEFAVYSINFWAMSDLVPAINLSGKKIAVLGDSWTQFPGVQNAISLYPDYNTLGTRPDGTALDGLAYFPKELARVTGATVDNWGKSNMRADNYGLEIIDTILAAKQYDYLIIEFFTNDVNASISAADWASNIALIAEKCKRACVRPLIMLPCRNNGATVNPLGVYHEVAMRGLGLM